MNVFETAVRIVFLSLALLATTACNQDVGFSEDASTGVNDQDTPGPGPGPDPEPPPPGAKIQTDGFTVRADTSGALDLVWVVDNSGSMSEEAANVEKNLARFITQVKTKTDLRMAVISAQSGSQGVRVPATPGLDLRVIDHQVESFNPLTLLALSFCSDAQIAKGASAFSSPPLIVRLNDHGFERFCALAKLQESGVPPEYSIKLVTNALSDNRFYRADAAKAFIVVTDDNSEPDMWVYPNIMWPSVTWEAWENGLTAGRFHSHLKARFVDQRAKVFSFLDPIGLDKRPSSECGNYPGKEYINLAKLTEAKTYDICEPDWTPHFDNLINSVVTLAQTQFKLTKTGVIAVTEVRIGGNVIAPSLYSFAAGYLSVDTALVESSIGKSLSVTYSYQ